MSENLILRFNNPPINEVVFGTSFKPIQKMKAAYIGLFWNIIKEEFPKCEQAPIIGPIDEIIDQETNLPVPRTWFINKEDDLLIQIQKNKFLLNWRKKLKIYPHFNDISKMFFKYINIFSDFVLQNDLGEIDYKNLDLTYINNIPQGEGWEEIKSIGSLFPDITWRDNNIRYLQDPEAIIWQAVFNLPDNKGKLIINLQPGYKKIDRHPLIILEITARGISNNKTDKGLHEWFNMAHEYIILSFKDLTSENVQNNIWRKINNV